MWTKTHPIGADRSIQQPPPPPRECCARLVGRVAAAIASMPLEGQVAAAPWPVPPPPSSPSILDRSVVLSQAALFVGACISVVACMTVVVKYMRFKSVRRPPLSLLFWRTVSDLFFAVQFLITLFVQLSVSRDSDYGGVFWGKLDEYATSARAWPSLRSSRPSLRRCGCS